MANRAEGSALRAPTKGGRRMQQITRRSFLWGVAVAAAAVLAGCGSASQPPPEEPADPEEFEPQTKTLTVSEGQSLTVTVAGFSVGMDHRPVLSLKLHNELGREITLSDSTGDGVLTVSARVDGSPAQILHFGLLGQAIPAGEVKEGVLGFPVLASFDEMELVFSLRAEGKTQSVQFEL